MLSVVIYTRNQLNLLREAYYHLHGYAMIDEILVVDDLSNDGTQERCVQRGLSLATNMGKTKLQIGGQINLGYEKAKGDKIIFMKPNVRFIDNSLQEIARSCEKNNVSMPSYFEGYDPKEQWAVNEVLIDCFAVSRDKNILPIVDKLKLYYIGAYLYEVADGEVETVGSVRIMPPSLIFERARYVRDYNERSFYFERDSKLRGEIKKKYGWK